MDITKLFCLLVGVLLSFAASAVRPFGAANVPNEQIFLRGDFTTSLFSTDGPPLTFARATVATVVDHDGLIRHVKSGEARFYGARRVENMLVNSYLANNGTALTSWSANGTAGSGTVTYGTTGNGEPTVTCTGTGTSDRAYIQQTVNLVAGRQYRISAYILSKSGTFAHDVMKLAASTAVFSGTIGWNGSATSGRVASGVISVTTSGTAIFRMGFGTDNVSTNVASVTFYKVMLEEVSGQSVQTPAEYVSTGELPAPMYHGAGVDGVKYFGWVNGNTVDGNGVVTEARGAGIASSTLRGLYGEATRTNSIARSEEINTWGVGGLNAFGSGSVVDTTATLSPDGRNAAEYLQEDTSTGVHRAALSVSHTTGTDYTFSIWGKAAERSWIMLADATDSLSVYANLSNCTLGTVTGANTDASIESWPNGWCRVVLKYQVPSTAAKTFAVNLATGDGGGSYTGDGVSGAYIFGGQHETLNGASSYILTTGAGVTRNTDSPVFPLPLSWNVTGGCFAKMQTSTATLSTTNVRGGMGVVGSACSYINNGAPVGTISTFDGLTGVSVVSGGSVATGIKGAAAWFPNGRQFVMANGVLNSAAYDYGRFTLPSSSGIGGQTWSTGAAGTIRDVILWVVPPDPEVLRRMTQ